jgi:thiamine monophosphate synthase
MNQAQAKKTLNPEQRLNASVARDVKRRQFEEATKLQADYLAVAKWDSALGKKDAVAAKRWTEEKLKADAELTNRYG